ncbi:type II secretion system GspH family protein [Massilia sp. G4R7]|uniref:Type II secretion system GspH family protein n=1 Tax=Massilia phyllostachyos TaxID=2898585 RepID=A0ABS8QBQ8_9BURK|nr:type II secretion system protein [Massilia phyllostachyos]MCD2519149.1 type II secretion system GspH family protein [Massilia phyllostachyos]
MKKHAGLTLVELLLAIAIMGLVLAALTDMLQSATRASTLAGEAMALQREADFALARVANHIATAPAPASSMWPGLDQKTNPENLFVTKFDTVEIFVDGASRLVEAQGPERRILADSVQSLSITATRSSGGAPLVQVALSLARGDAKADATSVVRLGSIR